MPTWPWFKQSVIYRGVTSDVKRKGCTKTNTQPLASGRVASKKFAVEIRHLGAIAGTRAHKFTVNAGHPRLGLCAVVFAKTKPRPINVENIKAMGGPTLHTHCTSEYSPSFQKPLIQTALNHRPKTRTYTLTGSPGKMLNSVPLLAYPRPNALNVPETPYGETSHGCRMTWFIIRCGCMPHPARTSLFPSGATARPALRLHIVHCSRPIVRLTPTMPKPVEFLLRSW